MIYTLTLNPNIDYFLRLTKPARLGEINRAAREWMLPGGKGVNVSLFSRGSMRRRGRWALSRAKAARCFCRCCVHTAVRQILSDCPPGRHVSM